MRSNDDFQNSEIADAQSLAFGPTVLEQVLCAIIKAHPLRSGKDSERSRVRKAMAALLGNQQLQTPFEDNRFDKALRHMAKQRHIDEAKVLLHRFKNRKESDVTIPLTIRSYAELAREAVSLYLPSESAEEMHSNAKRLEEMMSGRYQKKGGKHTDVDFAQTYRFRAVEHDYVGETLEAEDSELNREFGSKLLIAGVRRIKHPGVKFDTMLVLEGPQGAGKSSLAERLAVRKEWFCGNLDLKSDDKTKAELLARAWIVECQELDGMNHTTNV